MIISALAIGSEKSNPSVAFKNSNCEIITENSSNAAIADVKKEITGEGKETIGAEKVTTGGKKREFIGIGNIVRRDKSKSKGEMNDRHVYCICREEETPRMIGCDYCDEWYHTQCLNLSKDEVTRLANENWSCPNCELKKGK